MKRTAVLLALFVPLAGYGADYVDTVLPHARRAGSVIIDPAAVDGPGIFTLEGSDPTPEQKAAARKAKAVRSTTPNPFANHPATREILRLAAAQDREWDQEFTFKDGSSLLVRAFPDGTTTCELCRSGGSGTSSVVAAAPGPAARPASFYLPTATVLPPPPVLAPQVAYLPAPRPEVAPAPRAQPFPEQLSRVRIPGFAMECEYDPDHVCNRCGTTQLVISRWNRDGTHTHVCPRCRHSWRHRS